MPLADCTTTKEAIKHLDSKSTSVLRGLCEANPKAAQHHPKYTKADLICKRAFGDFPEQNICALKIYERESGLGGVPLSCGRETTWGLYGDYARKRKYHLPSKCEVTY